MVHHCMIETTQHHGGIHQIVAHGRCREWARECLLVAIAMAELGLIGGGLQPERGIGHPVEAHKEVPKLHARILKEDVLNLPHGNTGVYRHGGAPILATSHPPERTIRGAPDLQ